MKDIIEWLTPNDLLMNTQNCAAMEKYADYIQSISSNPSEILKMAELKRINFYSYMLHFAQLRVGLINGIAVDLGAGLGCFSAILSELDIDRLYSVEYSKSLLEKVFPIVFDAVNRKLNRVNKKNIVSRIWGDFENLQFEDNSIDFVFANLAVHHSSHPIKVLSEIRRILKPNGFAVLIENALKNNTPDKAIEEMGQAELGKGKKKYYGVSPHQKLTRSEMGEHDWREREWEEFFSHSNLQIINAIKVRNRFKNKLLHALLWRYFKYRHTDNALRNLFLRQKKVVLYPTIGSASEHTLFILKK